MLPQLSYNLGMLYFQMEAYDESLREFMDASQQERLAPFAFFAIGCCEYLSGKYYAAIEHFKETLNVRITIDAI